jgi:hypothetical protein
MDTAAHVATIAWERGACVPAWSDVDDLRVLLAARCYQIPLGRQLVFERSRYASMVPVRLSTSGRR